MALEQFRQVHLRIDRADGNIHQQLFAKKGDYNGRELVVQLTNHGKVEDLTDIVNLNFGWRHLQVGNEGVEPFIPLDATQGIFKVTYPTEMQNEGKVLAVIQMIIDGKITHTKNFIFPVEDIPFSEQAIISDNRFTVLQDALIKINQYQAEIDAIKQDLQEQGDNLLRRMEQDFNEAMQYQIVVGPEAPTEPNNFQVWKKVIGEGKNIE